MELINLAQLAIVVLIMGFGVATVRADRELVALNAYSARAGFRRANRDGGRA